MSDDVIISDLSLECAQRLAKAIEEGDADAATLAVDELTKIREGNLFQEMGRLTRELHESIKNFTMSDRIAELAKDEIPDAKDRLNHVIMMTEEAANKTLTAVEKGLPLSENIQRCSQDLHEKWQSFQGMNQSVDKSRELVKEMEGFFPLLTGDAKQLNKYMSEIMLAQDFQDLTGQIIRRVITLVQDVEESLVEMIRVTGYRLVDYKQKGKDIKVEGTNVPGTASSKNVVEGQDEVDDLLSSLGF